MTLDEHYICQRAANAIISEIGPFRVSTDALQAINQFLDEFIVLLLSCSLSLDLSNIKSIVFGLLPSTLGKNAIVEAELEVKTFTETESIDYDLYERMRNLGEDDTEFPLAEALPLLREKCFEYCTLADKDDQLYLQKSIRNKRIDDAKEKVAISPIVAIYVTTVMEHIAEYLLTAVAMTAEHEDTDYVRVKEVFLALIDDIQLGNVFQRMDLRDKMEKRAGLYNLNTNKARNSYLPPPSVPPNRKSYINNDQQETGSFLDITFDDMDLDFDDNRRSNIPDRPQSAMSYNSSHNYTMNNNRKSTFHLFKNNRNSFSGGDVPPRASPMPSAATAVYDPDAPSMDFDDLIKSGGTVKVTLTPNRLRSIEIKDQTKDELSPLTWERRSTSSPRLSAIPSRPSSPLVRQNTTSSVKTTASAKTTASVKTTTSKNSTDPIELPKITHGKPSSPSSPLAKKSFSVSEKSRFENPREAPPTPLAPLIPIATPSVVTTAPAVSNSAPKKAPPTPLQKLSSPAAVTVTKAAAAATETVAATEATEATATAIATAATAASTTATSKTATSSTSTTATSSRSSSDSLSSDISSVISIPSPVILTPAPAADTLSIIEPPVPKPTKSIPLNGMVLRRSSVSSKKSRENLRRAREEASALEEPMPTLDVDQEETMVDPTPTMVLSSKDDVVNITAEPVAVVLLDRQVHFDSSGLEVGAVVPRKKAATLSPERPSSMVAKRASMVGNRRRSLHESYATDKYHQDIIRQRGSNVGSVSVSIKQWDDILKPEEQINVIPPAAHRRSVLRQLRQQQLKEQLQIQQDLLQQVQEKEASTGEIKTDEAKTSEIKTNETRSTGPYLNASNNNSNAVLDKVLKFERASSLDDDVSHQRVSHMPRRERFLYLQQDPSAIERKSTIPSKKVPSVVIRRIGIDQGVQTDPPQEKQTVVPVEEEQGLVDGDEEWFLQDDEWDEQEETAIVEWLLGE